MNGGIGMLGQGTDGIHGGGQLQGGHDVAGGGVGCRDVSSQYDFSIPPLL